MEEYCNSVWKPCRLPVMLRTCTRSCMRPWKGSTWGVTVGQCVIYQSFNALNQLNPTPRNSTLKLQTSAELQMAGLETALVPAAAAPVLPLLFFFIPPLHTRGGSDCRPHWRSILLCLSSSCSDWQSVAISRHGTRASVPHWSTGEIPWTLSCRRIVFSSHELSIKAFTCRYGYGERKLYSLTLSVSSPNEKVTLLTHENQLKVCDSPPSLPSPLYYLT